MGRKGGRERGREGGRSSWGQMKWISINTAEVGNQLLLNPRRHKNHVGSLSEMQNHGFHSSEALIQEVWPET